MNLQLLIKELMEHDMNKDAVIKVGDEFLEILEVELTTNDYGQRVVAIKTR
ncbi:hypothetical protein SAMN04487969_102444 [Paenibacillus algorifonticola]|uniref:Uncharacterized protein n=1 Tax=Paenibacillus algorifonticola TaxID=684063 RepID=A0A1I2AEW8_9BACL|nr:hypothetical protein [Paenibacillus algorifonticola]SFE42257.1 hypothetical protein SAMN04487969_102444 [Paenibacillus algorifonticola]